jgi:hypothetical protein
MLMLPSWPAVTPNREGGVPQLIRLIRGFHAQAAQHGVREVQGTPARP